MLLTPPLDSCFTFTGGGPPPPDGAAVHGGGGVAGAAGDAAAVAPDLLDVIAEADPRPPPPGRRVAENAIRVERRVPPGHAPAADIELHDSDIGSAVGEDILEWSDDGADDVASEAGHGRRDRKRRAPSPAQDIAPVAPDILDLVAAAPVQPPAAPDLEPPAAAPAAALEPDGAEHDPGAARQRRAGRDGWPRLWLPSREGYARLSCNAEGVWDMRAICEICGATCSRTCKGPPLRARPGTKAFGQGRPLGKTWAWLRHGVALGPTHTAEQHVSFEPGLADRQRARIDASAQPGVQLWLDKERAPNASDGPDGEPLLVP